MIVILLKTIIYALISLSLLVTAATSYNNGYDRTVVIMFAAGGVLGSVLAIDTLLNFGDSVETVLFAGMMVLFVAAVSGIAAVRRRRDSA